MKIEDIKDISALSKEDRIRYDESIKVYRDRLVVMEYARQKGFEEGREEGRKKERHCPKFCVNGNRIQL